VKIDNLDGTPNNSKADDTVRLYGPSGKLRIGIHSRIDAFCVFTWGDDGLDIGDHVHISAGVYIFGSSGKVTIGNGCFLSPRSTIYTASDDIGFAGLVGPMVNPESRVAVWKGNVTLEDCSGVLTGGIVMPGVTLGSASVVGAQSICNKDLGNGEVMVGTNHRILYVREWRKILEKYRENH
jgi:galactoside O-acetyltransferase